VGPRWGEGSEEAKLRSAVRASLGHADRLDAESIALPAISTGIFGYPKQEGVRTIVDEVLEWLAEHPETSLSEIRLTAFDSPTAECFADALRDTD
jgi:O-acetyl-ADP-ribose deacetylase (regulator of RNase III)